jgi:alkylation response protein AidB-like acyl-CoA dehydrogenase
MGAAPRSPELKDRTMDFALTDEQMTLREEIVRFARTELNDDLVQRDADSSFSAHAWRRCAALGIQGLPVPVEYGGVAADPLTTMVSMEALGYGSRDNGLIFSLNAQMWSCEIPIVRFGTEDQKRRYLPRLCDGSLIGVQCMTEPDTGSDAFNISTTAVRKDGRFVLNGAKTFITNAPVAGVFVVFASTDRPKGFAGISAFLVERGTEGVSVGPPFHKMGLRTSPMSEVVFSDCEVGADQLLGPEGAGAAIFNHSMDWERSCILASSVGSMQRQLEESIAYAKERRQFGQPIGKFQAVAHRIVDMKLRLETARLLVYRLGWLKSNGKPAPLDSALVKLYLGESFLASSLDTMQIHGGYGYLTESELEREVRDAVAGRIYSGTSEIQRNLVATHLGL